MNVRFCAGAGLFAAVNWEGGNELGLWVFLSLAVVDLILSCGRFDFTMTLFLFTLP